MKIASAMTALLKLPTLYVAHGGGPLPVLGDPGHAGLTAALRRMPGQLGVAQPTAILVVSAHWEERVPTVTSGPNPSLIYDYYGFPPESYSLKYPAPGDPRLAARVAQLLRQAGLEAKEDPDRGWDHGTFIPLLLSHPAADVPVVQLSLVASLNPDTHLAMGRALAPLRDEGVLIYASGLSFHNMSHFMAAMGRGGPAGGPPPDPRSVAFDDYLNAAAAGDAPPEERWRMLAEWAKAPHARFAHPREEHLLPLMVAFGAAEGEPGQAVQRGALLGAQVSSFAFGAGEAEGGKEEL